MNWRVSIRPKAKADLVRARDWYEDRCSGLGDELLVAVAETLVRLEAAPEQFPFYYRGFRRGTHSPFSLQIILRIKGDSVIVCRIPSRISGSSRETGHGINQRFHQAVTKLQQSQQLADANGRFCLPLGIPGPPVILAYWGGGALAIITAFDFRLPAQWPRITRLSSGWHVGC